VARPEKLSFDAAKRRAIELCSEPTTDVTLSSLTACVMDLTKVVAALAREIDRLSDQEDS